MKAAYDFREYTGKEPSGANLSSGFPTSFGDSLPNTPAPSRDCRWATQVASKNECRIPAS